MPQSIAVKFTNGPKLHYVQIEAELLPEVDEACVVSTRRGLELATIRSSLTEQERSIGYFVRLATDDDLDTFDKLAQKAEELKWLLKAKVRENNPKTKIVALEFNLDESLLVVSYTSEEQLPLRSFVQELLAHTSARVEFVNVGPRDQVRLLGAIGVCGDGTCSSTWLQSFSAVGIRMARDQQLPLNPEKISGPCGRLMCCLQYEHEMYEELLAAMPRRGSRACHENSGTCGRVHKVFPLKNSLELMTDEGGIIEYPAAEVQVVDKRRMGY